MNEKTALNAQLLQRHYRYYLNDTEIALQSARLTSLKLGVSHLYYGAHSQIALTADALAGVGKGSSHAEQQLRAGGSMLKPFMHLAIACVISGSYRGNGRAPHSRSRISRLSAIVLRCVGLAATAN